MEEPNSDFFDTHPLFPKYTPKELELIKGAVMTASNYIENAYQTLAAMLRFYFFTDYGISSLSYDADEAPEAIAGQLYAILDLLKEARRDLNTFTNPTNKELYPINRDIQVRKYYLDAYTNDAEDTQSMESVYFANARKYARKYLRQIRQMIGEEREVNLD